MVYKRYVKVKGKKFGPYHYESYRDKGGKARTRYVSKASEYGQKRAVNSKKNFFQNKTYLILLSIVLVILFIVLFSFFKDDSSVRIVAIERQPQGSVTGFATDKTTDSLTGGAVTETIVESYVFGELIEGQIDLNLKEGELIPKGTVVSASLGNQQREFVLSEFVNLASVEGNFYAENSKLSGFGAGYGVVGEKKTYYDVDFDLLIFEEDSGSDSSPESKEEIVVEEDEGDIEESEESEEEEDNGEEDSGGEDSSQGDETEVDDGGDSEGGVITGEAISEAEYTVSGVVSFDNAFDYNLEEGQSAKIVSGSVEVGGERVSDSEVSLEIENGKVIVSTDYHTSEKGFGEEYLGESGALIFRITLEDLEFEATMNILSIVLKYGDEVISLVEKEITISGDNAVGDEEILLEINESNNVSFDVGNLSLIQDIQSIRVAIGGGATLDLSEHFFGAESYTLNVADIDATFDNHLLTLIPAEGFKGARKATVIASSGDVNLESNEFLILVSSGAVNIQTKRKKIIVGEPVKWTTNVSLENPENVSIEIPNNSTKIVVLKKEAGEFVEEDLESNELEGNLITGNVVIAVELRKKERGSVFISKAWKWLKEKMKPKVTGKAIADFSQQSGIEIVLNDPSATEYIIEYETPAPEKTEVEKESGKLVTITGPDEFRYTDVIAFTEIANTVPNENKEKIKLYWYNYEYNQISQAVIEEAVSTTPSEVPTEEVVKEISISETNSSNLTNNPGVSITANVIAIEKKVEVGGYIRQEILFDSYDLDFDGNIDYLEWVVPHLSNQTYEIIIEITKAEHLDTNRVFVSDIYGEVKALDGNWSENIPEGHYVRVVFEKNLTSVNDITVYPRIVSGTPRIEIYEFNASVIVAEFSSLTDNEYNKVYLDGTSGSGLGNGSQDTFDLLILDGDIEFDHIIDPSAQPGGGTGLRVQGCSSQNEGAQNTYGDACDGAYPSACGGGGDLLSCDDGIYENQSYSSGSFAGVNASFYNDTIANCESVDEVFLCYEWWSEGVNSNCLVAVDAEGGDNYSTVTSTCPGTSANPGVTCTNVTSSEPWSCGNFFGSSGTRALARNELDSGGLGTDYVVTDVLFFNVSYTEGATSLTDCGALDSANTVYSLQNDVSTTGTCFNITADNVTLNGQGYTVAGDGGSSDHGVYASERLNVSIKNLNISNIGRGVYLEFTNNSLVENISAGNLGSRGVYLGTSYGNIVQDNNLSSSGNGFNVYFISVGDNNIIKNNIVNDGSGSVSAGIRIDSGSNNTIQNNTVLVDSVDGIRLSTASGNFLYNNTIVGSGSNSIRITGSDNVIIGGSITDSGNDAISLGSSNNSLTDINISNTDASSFDIVISSAGINGTKLIDMPQIGNYSISGIGGTIIFEDSTFGEIRFLSNVSGSGSNLTDDVRIGNNSVVVESGSNGGLNVSANVTFYGIGDRGFNNPTILRDGSECASDVCYNFTALNADTVVFNVSYWTNYSIGEGDLANPLISFGDGTPANGSTQSNTDIYVNLSTSDDAGGHYAFTDFDNDLMFWMRFDDTNSSGEPTGLSSYSNNGSLKGNAFINETGYFGNASQFDGNGDYINTTFNDVISNGTISFWMYTRNNYSSTRILGSHNDFEVSISTGSPPGQGLVNPQFCGNDIFYAQQSIDSNKWYHIAAKWDEAKNNISLYINGVFDSFNDTVSLNCSVVSGELLIGCRPGACGTTAFNGTLDEVLIFNRSLSSGEINALYNASANQYFNNFTSLNEGAHTFTGYAVDLAGNKNQTDERTVTVDATALNVTIASPLNNSNYNSGTVDFNVSLDEEGSWCGYSVNGAANITMTKFNNTYFNFTNTSVADGSHTVLFSCNDTVNNYGASDVSNFLVDTIIPTISYQGDTPANASTQNHTSIFVNVSANDTNEIYGFTDFDSSLLGWWRFDNDASAGENVTHVLDWAPGSVNNGSALGGASPITNGRFGGGYSFDGVNDYINIPSNPIFDELPITISFWIYNPGGWDRGNNIIDNREPIGNNNWQIQPEGEGQAGGEEDISMWVNVSGPGTLGDVRTSNNNVPIGKWSHITGIDDGTNLSLFVNGQLINTTEIPGARIITPGQTIWIARRKTWIKPYTEMSMDELLIFNRVLSADEIATLYNATKQFYNNYTNLSDGTHTFTSYVVDEGGNKNQTDERTVTVGLFECRDLDEAGRTYVLQNNVTTVGNCFNITADNITLDGNGYNIGGDGDAEDSAVIAKGRLGLTVKNFNISSIGQGVYFNFTNSSTVENITGTVGKYGILHDSVYNNIIQDNNMSCTDNGCEIIRLVSSENNVVQNNYPHDCGGSVCSGIHLSSSSNNNITNNSAVDNAVAGIRLTSSNGNYLLGNVLINNGNGLASFIIGGSNNSIENGEITNSGDDALSIAGSNNTFTNLTITGTNVSFYDVVISQGTNETYLIDMPHIGNYSISGIGAKIIVKDSDFGEIRFLSNVSGSGSNLTNDIRIGNNSVVVESETNAGLNVSANITLYGIGDRGFSVPVILRDGVECSGGICSNFTALDADTVLFNVSYWTNYSIGNNDTAVPLISFGVGTENDLIFSDVGWVYVNVSITESDENNILFELYNSSSLVNATSFIDGRRTMNWTGLSDGVYSYNVSINDTGGRTNVTSNRNLTLISSCLSLDSCTEDGTCDVVTSCSLYSGLCSGSICDFTEFSSNATIYTLYNGSGDGRDLELNISNITFKASNTELSFSGKNGTDIGSGSRGGHAGTVNITVPWLFNTTNVLLRGIGGYSTLSGTVGGNGGTLQMNYHGLIRNFTDVDFDPFALDDNGPTVSGGNSLDSGAGSGGTLVYAVDSKIPRDADVDGDGIIISSDRKFITDRYNNLSTDGTYVLSGDINNDGKINVIDITRVGFEWLTRGNP